MGTAQDSSVEQIAAAIERYLDRNPSAVDSVVGIVQWWLPVFDMEVAPNRVEEALLLLQSRGVVEEVAVADQQSFWRMAERSPGRKES